MRRVRGIAAFALLASLIGGGAVSLALLLGAFTGGPGGADEEASSSAGPIDGAASTASDSGLDEGIQVHGDWVIEVRNADGSVAERREFQNAFIGNAANYLDLVLARNASVGEWGLTIIGGGICVASTFCFISEVGGTHSWGTPPEATFATLEISAQQNPNEFVLQGNFDALGDGEIAQVHSLACFAIPLNLDASACNNTFTFTATTLQSPVSVTAGQQVLVTVRISFS